MFTFIIHRRDVITTFINIVFLANEKPYHYLSNVLVINHFTIILTISVKLKMLNYNERNFKKYIMIGYN